MLHQLAADRSPNIWQEIKKLTSPPICPILEIVNADGNTSRRAEDVRNKWYSYISRLFSGLKNDPDIAYDDTFYEEIIKKKEEFDLMSSEDQKQFFPSVQNSEVLNHDIELKEVN